MPVSSSKNEVARRLRTMSVYDVFSGTLDEAADEIDFLADEVTRLQGLIDTAKADAWDEGHTHCFHVENPNNPIKDNPYRKATS